MHDAPLVVMRDDLLGFGEDVAWECSGHKEIDDAVVKREHRVMQLRHDEVFIIARVADDRREGAIRLGDDGVRSADNAWDVERRWRCDGVRGVERSAGPGASI